MFKFLRPALRPAPQLDREQVIAAEIARLSNRRIYHDDCISELESEIEQAKAVIDRAAALVSQHTIARDVTFDAIVAFTAHVAASDCLLLEAAE